MKKIIFDIETSNLFSDIGSNNPADLNLAILSLYSTDLDEYLSFEQKDLSKALELFKQADLLISYNGKHFDIPILQKYTNFNLSQIKHIDLLEEIKKSLKKRIKLNSVASATLGTEKIADGLQSIIWWREGLIDKVKKYCEKDVEITKKIYDFALENNFLYYNSLDGDEKIKIILETKNWENKKNSLFN